MIDLALLGLPIGVMVALGRPTRRQNEREALALLLRPRQSLDCHLESNEQED